MKLQKRIAGHAAAGDGRPLRLIAALACAFALACGAGLAACGQATTEPGGTQGESQDATALSAQGADADQLDGTSASADTSEQDADAAQSAGESGESDDTHGDSLDADKALEGQTDAHPVSFTIEAPGYSSSDGKIPIAVAGERSDGTAVDATAYLDGDGDGLALAPGSYTVTVIESPLMSGARFFRAPGKSWDVEVSDALSDDETVQVDGTIAFTEMDLSELTKDEVETAYTYAVSGGLPTSTAKSYRSELLKAAGLD